ncbi:prephenate dehydratase [Kangiella koreensis]|uniref:Bifunctional chorismate mutase/prephenate dehydratase n=1 Tax=Kangiella koreensis (strain DSM 16069 / JCM 12317 / KCTC 12182 / SW-125) TaxID=523791 RepID=C7RCK4_KANKD|nr:prephenate dehydratase [Kangiella koreensis]ACV26996.1 Prephenate dehydratase [Kangiella koreensis DSM 16069]
MNKPEVDLKQLRKAISSLDSELLSIFAQRRQLSLQVAAYKFDNSGQIRDEGREKKLLTQLVDKGLEFGIAPNTTLTLFHSIIEDSVRSQYDFFLEQEKGQGLHTVKVAVLGEPESYSHIALKNHFSTKKQRLETVHCHSFMQIFKEVDNGSVDLGIVPIENTTSGNITEIYDLLTEHHLKIVGEEKLKVRHCLVGTEQASLETLKDVYSHPQAIAQCKKFFLDHPHIQSHFRSSSSSAIKLVAEYQNPSIGAIASEQAAEQSGLKVLSYAINNYQENYTRFLLIAKQAITVPSVIPAKTTLALETGQQPGALLDCLQILKNHRINMSKLESRPIPTQPWHERFYIDLEGNASDSNVLNALDELEKVAHKLECLGCYAKHDVVATKLDTSIIEHSEQDQ